MKKSADTEDIDLPKASDRGTYVFNQLEVQSITRDIIILITGITER